MANRLRSRRRRVAGVAAAAVFGAAGWATGGFDAAPPPDPGVLRPGETVDQGRFRVAVTSARVIRLAQIFGKAKRPYLDVAMRVVNDDTSTQMLISTTGFTAGVTVTTRGRPLVDDKRQQTDDAALKTSIDEPDGHDIQLHPDFPADVHTVWALRDGPLPDQVTIGLREWTWVKGLTQPDSWQPGGVTAEITLPVEGR